jgi:FKBP-type peptidyl-prolyl cis-trans isomerase FkpA
MEKKWTILVSLLCGASVFGGKVGSVCSDTKKACESCQKGAEVAKKEAVPEGEAAKPEDAPKPKVYTEIQERQYCQIIGCSMAKQSGVGDLGLSAELVNCFVEGFKQALQGQKSICDDLKPDELRAAMQYFQQRFEEQAKIREAKEKKTAEENKKKAEDFFKKLDQNSKIKKAESSLRYEVLDPGASARPGLEHEVTIHYVGKLIDGTVFDSSRERNEPVELPLGQVIPGFSEGLQLVGKGGKINLWIPSDLGYGDRDLPKIPAGSTLVFEVEVLDFKEAPKPEFDFEQIQTALKKAEEEKKAAEGKPDAVEDAEDDVSWGEGLKESEHPEEVSPSSGVALNVR